MIEVVLYQPEIPPNTGNIIRLCANTGAGLHLVKPLGFELDDARLRRAGLDYAEWARIRVHEDWPRCLAALPGRRCYAFTTKGKRLIHDCRFRSEDVLLFGPETRGLPEPVLASLDERQCVRIPMREGSRSMNLSNSVAVAVYEAWRQLGFEGGI